MGKPKRAQRPAVEEDPDSDSDVEQTAPETRAPKGKAKPKAKPEAQSDDDSESNTVSNKPAKKKSVDNKKVAQVSKDLKRLELEKKKAKKNETSSDDESDTESDSPAPSKKIEPSRGGFALLQMDDSDSDDSDKSEERSESEEEAPKVAPKKKPSPAEASKEPAGKKGKKKKKGGEDDIDQVLAELEQEYAGKRPPPGKKDKLEEEATQEKNEDANVADSAKTAAQKKKEKKLRQMAAKKAEEQKEATPEPSSENVAEKPDETESVPTESKPETEAEGDKKKKKKKGEKPVVEEKTAKKGPAKKAIAAMQEALKKIKEEEERLQKEEEERIRLEEEREEQRLEQLRLEKEKKERKKKKEKERIDKLKAEGKFLTPKQKADKARALAMIEALKGQGAEIATEPIDQPKKARLGTRIRPNKLKKQSSDEQPPAKSETDSKPATEAAESKTTPPSEKTPEVEKEPEAIQESWDAESVSSDNDKADDFVMVEKEDVKSEEIKPEESSSEDEDSESEDESDDSDDNAPEPTSAPPTREVALSRMKKREEENENDRSGNIMRAAVVCVLGHVDTGKTKILDKLRRTNVQDGEAGGITQQIGATNVPIDNIKDQTRHVKGVNSIEFKIPGLLIIDTPGHESFSNLRSRGSSLCDIAILVVDIMHGLEPQTIESLNLLKARKTPFIVALNKIDRLYDWQSAQRKDVKDIIKSQHQNTQNEFETRTKETILQFAEQGLNAALYYENPDVRTYVSLVPTSAVTGEGMGNLLAIIIQSCESLLHKRLLFSRQLQATVLEVKAIPGLGMTIDCILINGSLKEGDTIVLAGTDGPIVTQIRSLLMPQPMKELRVKNAYIEYKEIIAAQGVKITAKDLEKAVAGLNLHVAHKPDEIEILKEDAARELKSALSGIKLSERGVYVQASTLGSLEALLEFLKASKIPYSAIRIGPVVKRDVMKASAMLEHEPQYACILAFDVKIERDAQEMADSLGVTIFQADIIYHLFDKFMAHREQLKAKKREEFKHIAVFPCKLKILPQFVFNSRDPIVIGVIVEAGIVKEGTPICVPSKEFVDIGIVTSIEMSHKQVETARKGMEVCIKIDPIPGESPKMYGRHFDENDFLVSKISRPSIDACKDYFRDDLLKTDWQLMVELKNLFQIL